MSRGKFLWAVLAVVILAAFFRLYDLASAPPGLYPDEAMNGNNALEAIATGNYKLYYPENNGREGLFMNIQSLFVRALGNEPWVLRLPSAIFGILTVLGLYLLGQELFSRRVGLLASFFLATSVWHIIFSRIGFRAITAPFFLTWGLYFFLRALRENKDSPGLDWGAWFSALGGGLLFGLGFHSYIAYRVAPLLLLVPAYFLRARRNFGKILLLFLAGAFLAGLPIGIYYLQNPEDFLGRTSQISVFSMDHPLRELALNTLKTAGMFFWAGDYNWRHNPAGRPQLFWPVGIALLAGAWLGLRAIFSRAGRGIIERSLPGRDPADREAVRNLKLAFWLIFWWLVLALLPVIISSEGLPHALRAILMLPPVMLLAAVGGWAIWDHLRAKVRPAWLIRFLGGALLLFLIFEPYRTYFGHWAKNPHTAGAFNAEYVELGRDLRARPDEALKYVVVEAGGVLVRGIPMPSQTVMFLTDTFTPEKQRARNLYYVNDLRDVPPGAEVYYIR